MGFRSTTTSFLVAFLSLLLDACSAQPSLGCSRKHIAPSGSPNSLLERNVTVSDFEAVVRTYFVQLPNQLSSAPSPLLLSFHGQTGTADDFGSSHNFTIIGKLANLLAVFPQGMNDSVAGEEQGTGWNIGSSGQAGNATCIPQGVGSNGGCYKSCRKLGKCGRCNWSTCYDDVLFVKRVIAAVTQEFCIDLSRVYLHGESNGAEMLQHLVREMPDTFAGVAPWFGTPLLGFLTGRNQQLIAFQNAIAETALLALHARQDVTIPPRGGVSDGGWIFEPEEQVLGVWAAIHECEGEKTPLVTPWDGGRLNFACAEHLNCKSARRVMYCMYDGVHGDWPNGTSGDEITVWFLLQFARDTGVALVV